MNILVIDGQGGQLGSQLVKAILQQMKEAKVMAVGTNAIATAAMLKAGAHQASTGENPVVVACRKADVIIGPIGIVIADAMFGEVTPAMAVAVAQADAVRILLPVNKCDNLVAGVPDLSMSTLIADVMVKLHGLEKQVASDRKTC
jgi:dTDP-4-dehydrorhamnose reductase